MTQDIFIGVDGGGTKCKVRVEDAAGKLLGEAKGGPASISLSIDNAWNSIYTAVKEALASAKISLQDSNCHFYVGLGLAGTEVPKDVKDFLARPYPFTEVYLKSDAYAACLGAHAGQDGAIIIIGTGVVGLRIKGDNAVQVGGWGFPHGDEGGGAWLGLEAVRLTLQAYDGRIDSSPLLDAVLAKFDNDFFGLVTWAMHGRSTQFAEIAPLVIKFAAESDTWAVLLMQRAAAEIERIAFTMEERVVDGKVPYSLFGGVAPHIEPWLNADLRAKLVPRQFDATKGAIFMIKRKLGLALN